MPVWVRLPDLSIHCWNFEPLQKIRNGIGKFVDKADNKNIYNCAMICVEVNLEAGLPEAVKLKVGTWTHFQKLDYEHLPFKCRLCQEHEHGHFQRNCPKNQALDKEETEGWHKVKRSKPASKPKEPRPDHTQNQPQANVNPPKEPQAKDINPPKEPEKECIEIASHSAASPENPSRKNNDPIAKEALRSDEENITLDSETGADSDGGATETSSSVGTPERNPRGRKPDRKKREEKSYRDVTAGVQQTIPDMIETRSSKKGRAPKGATPPSS